REILREHTLDWLLCNFDTKGENFLNRTDGHLSSFDKEASFARIKDAGSQHMSTEYRPHANDTLYNVMFSEYARGNLDLDLQSTENQLQRIEGMREDDYLALFDRMLTQKYGARGPKNRERTAVEATIWERKANLREEYRRFYTELLARRRESLRAQGGEDDTGRYFDAQGEFRFEHEAQQQR
ncbi:MAG: hypothetical protein LBP30_07990, partial [Clostridiales Family XIII bacterium]|nr:hypothetical protein [Clostridiales Family XIII bacterium]